MLLLTDLTVVTVEQTTKRRTIDGLVINLMFSSDMFTLFEQRVHT